MRVITKTLVLALAISFIFASGAMAAPFVTDLFGDKDNFGLGETAFNWALVGSGDGDGTDVMMRVSEFSWDHTYDLTGLGELTSAGITINHANLGLGGAAQLRIDGVTVASLENSNAGAIAIEQYIDLTDYLDLLVGANTFSIVPYTSSNAWFFDYAELTVWGSDPKPLTEIIEQPMHAPIPGAVWLLGSGLIGLVGLRRKL